MECTHREAVREVVRTLENYGYIVKTEVWVSAGLGHGFENDLRLDERVEGFKIDIANALLGNISPWIHSRSSKFQTRLDVVGLYYADCKGLPLYTFFVKTDAGEISLRTILIEVEHRHSIEEALSRLKGLPAGKKGIVWTEGDIGGELEGIPIVVARDDGFGCYIPKLYEILEEHIDKIRRRPSRV